MMVELVDLLIGYWLIGYWLIGYWLIGYWLIGYQPTNNQSAFCPNILQTFRDNLLHVDLRGTDKLAKGKIFL